MESAWSNGKAAYRCRHGYTTAAPPGPDRPGNASVREDRVLPRLPALHLLLDEAPPVMERRRIRRGTDARQQPSPAPRAAAVPATVGQELEHGAAVLIFGDARGNFRPAEEATLAKIARRAEPHCTAAVTCRTLNDLRRFIEQLG